MIYIMFPKCKHLIKLVANICIFYSRHNDTIGHIPSGYYTHRNASLANITRATCIINYILVSSETLTAKVVSSISSSFFSTRYKNRSNR